MQNKKIIRHAGIKGQRWGVRRFQNEDGTLTAEGKQRYGVGTKAGQNTDEQAKKILENQYHVADTKAAKSVLEGTEKSFKTAAETADKLGVKSGRVNKSDYAQMSDAEIRKRIDRLSMEKKYGELSGDTKAVRTGADWTREVLQSVGAIAGIGASITATILAIRQIQLGRGGGNP